MIERTKKLFRLGATPIWPARRWRLLLPLSLVATTVVLLFSTHELESRVRSPLPLSPTLPYHPALACRSPFEPTFDLTRVDAPQTFTLRWGQSLGGLLDTLGLERPDAYDAVEAMKEHLDVRRVRAGESGTAYFDGSGQMVRLRLGISGKGRLDLARDGDGWTSTWHEFVREVELRHVEGVLDAFLVSDIREAGGDPAVAFKMSDVLQWDLDFNRDLRTGDRFEVLYEDVRVDGQPAGPGKILALTYENRGRLLEAYRYGEDGFYYDAEGKPLRKMFLRSPLPFSRVTSRFSHRRFHPVLKIHRPHYGVDYGAPTGTAVRVTAGGVVAYKGWTKGGGNTVKVRHPNGYLTAYLHLSRYAKGLRTGQRVRQEEIIGYVGATGLATGPHLDYRVQKNGRWIDPLRLPNKPADPIPEEDLPSFLTHRDELRARLAVETAS